MIYSEDGLTVSAEQISASCGQASRNITFINALGYLIRDAYRQTYMTVFMGLSSADSKRETYFTPEALAGVGFLLADIPNAAPLPPHTSGNAQFFADTGTPISMRLKL